MGRADIVPSGREIRFPESDLIVSKTDLQGKITYVNDVFVAVSGYSRAELIGAPHSLIRHPEMPRCVFKLLWDTIQSGHEIFAYVMNMARSGDHYWVFAHVTPSYALGGEHVGYHSNRRAPYVDALPAVQALYARLRGAERARSDRPAGLAASTALLEATLAEQHMEYAEFVFGLSKETRLDAAAA